MMPNFQQGLRKFFFRAQRQKGFTLLESILALALLSAVISNIVGLQSSTLSATLSGLNNIKASWAIRSALSQVNYVVDTKGAKAIPEKKIYVWKPDTNFVVTVSRKALNELKPSALVISAISIFNKASGGKNENVDANAAFAGLGNILDSSIGTDVFYQVTISLGWAEGVKNKSIEDGLIFIDRSKLSSLKNIGK